MKLRTVFIGGLSNGKIVHDYLQSNRFVDLALVITHKPSYNGPRARIIESKSEVLRTGSAAEVLDRITALAPDLIVVAGWSELLPDSLYRLPVMGTIGFHPSKLPDDKGRSVLAWQIEEGYTSSALTMFYYNDFPDGGDIIGQSAFKIGKNDYISDVLDKIDEATRNLIYSYFPLVRQGIAPRTPQPVGQGIFRRLRTEADLQINWRIDSETIYDKIRAVSTPYPGAIGEIEGKSYKIFRAEILPAFPFGGQSAPGTMVASLYDRSFVVKTRDGFIRITDYVSTEKNSGN